MYLLFLDESGEPSGKSFALGGIAVRADEWQIVRSNWEGALTSEGWPLDREPKWHGIQTGEVPPALADALFESIASSPVTCFVVVLRPIAGRKQDSEFFESDDDTYATGLTFVAERFQRFLEDHNSYGVIVLDGRRREVDDRMRRYFERIQREGTGYRELGRIVDSLLLGPSHRSLGLQVADLVVASTLKAQYAMGDASRWFRQLEPRFARHPGTGEIQGVGLKVFPPPVKGEEEPPSKLF